MQLKNSSKLAIYSTFKLNFVLVLNHILVAACLDNYVLRLLGLGRRAFHWKSIMVGNLVY